MGEPPGTFPGFPFNPHSKVKMTLILNPDSDVLSLKRYSTDALQRMKQAGSMVIECQRVLANAQQNIVSDLIRFTHDFREWDHLPENDVHDRESHSQFYYHTHAKPEDSQRISDAEHGHFHTFLRAKGMPVDISPYALDPATDSKAETDPVSHIIGISMNVYGQPINLFTTNRWVTKETWYEARDVIKLLDCFEIDHSFPSWPVNLWVTNMLRLFRPQIEALLLMRDRKIKEWQLQDVSVDVFEDRALEVTSLCPVGITEHLSAIEQVLQDRYRQRKANR